MLKRSRLGVELQCDLALMLDRLGLRPECSNDCAGTGLGVSACHHRF